ncbi:MAG: TetR/AcrR family transcriptional regulator [Massilia sp.]
MPRKSSNAAEQVSPDEARPGVPKTSSIRSLKRDLVREEIVKSAAQLFAHRGVRNVSLEEVASGLGYSKSSVYYYFKSKDELLWAVFSYISGHFVGNAERIASVEADPMNRLKELIRMHVRFLAEHLEWATVFYRDAQALPEERQKEVRGIIVKYDSIFRQAVLEGTQNGSMQPIPPEVAVNAILGACNWMVNWISPKHQQNINQITDTYIALFTDGLATRRPD